MTKQEFLAQLQRALNGKIGNKEAAAFVDYYQEYIEIETRKGRSQQDIMEELGSPRLIAHSIIDASEHAGHGTTMNDVLFKYGKKLKDKCISLCEKTFEQAQKWFENL